MSKISQKQMNVPLRTRNEEEVQTDVNLISLENRQLNQYALVTTGTNFLQFINESWLEPFSDYYLLSQLTTIIQQLKTNSTHLEESKVSRIIHELSSKIHGLLSRQLKLCNSNQGYYQLLMEKEREIIRQRTKYGVFEKKINDYQRKIVELQREIHHLRNNLKLYQSAAEQNQLYKGFFKDFRQLTVASRKITDYEKLLNQQILPKIKDFEISLGELSKNSGRDRTSKQRATISRFALELDNLNKSKDLSWEALGNSASAFYSSIQHLNDDNWINHRINLSDSYDLLRTRHTSLLALINKNITELQKDPSFKKFSQIKQFINVLDQDQRQGFQVFNVNGWIGLGAIHCHRQHDFSEDVLKLRSLIALFQGQLRRLIQRYPQLDSALSIELRQFLKFDTGRNDGDALAWLKEILVTKTEVVHVDNVYQYNNEKHRKQLLDLRILVKFLLEELRRLSNDYKVGVQLPESLLQLLKCQQLDGISIEDIMGMFVVPSTICEVQVLVNKPVFIPKVQTVGIPLRQQKAVIASNNSHFAVNIQQGIPYQTQIPYPYPQNDFVITKQISEKAYGVPTKVVQQITCYVPTSEIERVDVQKVKYVQVVRQNMIEVPKPYLQIQQRQVQRVVNHQIIRREVVQVEVEKPVPITTIKQINKIFKVEQVVPKVYKQTKFEVVEKPVHHVLIQKQIEFVEVQRPIIQQSQVPIPIQVIVQKLVTIKQHCDCQKPEVVPYREEKAIHVEVPKEIIIEKCHYVQGNIQERIVEVACHTQVPLFKQVLKQVPVIIQKLVPFKTRQEKLVFVDRHIPFVVQKFTPVELIVQKPVIVRDIKHVPVEVQHPVPVYIQIFVPKIVEVTVERIVQKIVQVPRVVVVQKIVQKIVPIPRIVEKIKIQTQIVQVPFFIQTPVLQIVQIPVEKIVTNIVQKEKIVNINRQVLKIEKQIQKVIQEKIVAVATTLTQIEPVNIEREKIVRVIEEREVELVREVLVDRIVEVRQIVPVEQRVQIPIQKNIQVPVLVQKPIFYKQPVVHVDVQVVNRQVVVPLKQQTTVIRQVQKPCIVKQIQIVQIPGETVILKQPQLHIVQIQKQQVITATDIQYVPETVYIDREKLHVIEQDRLVIPEKETIYLKKPYAVSIEKPIPMVHQSMVVVESPDTIILKTREGLAEQIVNVVTRQVVVPECQIIQKIVQVPKQIHHVVYEKLPPQSYPQQIMVTNESSNIIQVQNTKQVQSTNLQVLTKTIQVPVHMEKLFQKIMLLPQIVEIEKKVYMIQQINQLVQRQASIQTHYTEYQALVKSIQTAANDLLLSLKTGKQANVQEMRNKLNIFLQLLRNESKMPKIVQTIKQVEVVREKDRPVIVYSSDTARQKVLLCIISDLINGIKITLDRKVIDNKFPDRIKRLLGYEFGLGVLSEGEGIVDYVSSTNIPQIQGKWRQWLQTYDRKLGSRIQVPITQSQQIYMLGFGEKDVDAGTLKAALQRQSIIHSQRLHQLQRLKAQQSVFLKNQQTRVEQLQKLLYTQRYYKDLYLNELLKIRKLLQLKNYQELSTILTTITTIQQDVLTSTIRITTERPMDRQTMSVDFSDELKRTISQNIGKISYYENQLNNRDRQINNLRLENRSLRNQIDQIQLNLPVKTHEGVDRSVARFNDQWEQKIRLLQKNHFAQLNHLREQLVRRITGDSQESTDHFAKSYEELMKRYNQLSDSQMTAQNNRRNTINSYEDRIRDLSKQLLTIKRDYQTSQKKSENERKKIIDDYQRRLTSTVSNQQNLLRRQLQTLRKNYSNLQQRSQTERKRLVDEYQKRMTSTGSNQERQLRRQLQQVKRNNETAQQRFQTEKKRIIDDYEVKMRTTVGSNQERQLRRQLQNLKRNYQNLVNSSESDKKRIVDDYETKLRSVGGTQERQLRKQLDNLKRTYENYQKNTETQKNRTTEDYERKIRQMQDDLQRAKTIRRGGTGTQQQNQQLQNLKDKIKRLEIELETSKKQIESYQKSRLGQTTYTSGIKQSILQSQFQSPQNRYRSSGPKFEQGEGSGGLSKQQQFRSSQQEKGRVSRSGVRQKIQQGQQVRSSSSRVSGGSEGSTFKSSMTLRQLMDIKKAEDKDSIITLVIIKVIEKIQQQADKGIINSYSPNNIYLSNFNPSNLQSLIVRFGAPITNRKNKTDGLYLSPEVLRGEGTSLKSVVFTLAVIWDELIHYQIYYKSTSQIENLAHEYKVRDTSLNPILRNTLFEMMSKDPNKRLQLGEAKRRLSLQRYIVSQGKAGTSTSRVTSQSRKNL